MNHLQQLSGRPFALDPGKGRLEKGPAMTWHPIGKHAPETLRYCGSLSGNRRIRSCRVSSSFKPTVCGVKP